MCKTNLVYYTTSPTQTETHKLTDTQTERDRSRECVRVRETIKGSPPPGIRYRHTLRTHPARHTPRWDRERHRERQNQTPIETQNQKPILSETQNDETFPLCTITAIDFYYLIINFCWQTVQRLGENQQPPARSQIVVPTYELHSFLLEKFCKIEAQNRHELKG